MRYLVFLSALLLTILTTAWAAAEQSPAAAQSAAKKTPSTQTTAQTQAQATTQPSPIVFWKVNEKEVDAEIHNVPLANVLRLAALRKAFQDAECIGDNLREQPVVGGKNLICTLPGSAPDTILVLAHYEHEGKGMGAIDNWTAAAMLPLLYNGLVAAPRQFTFIFADVFGKAGAQTLMRSMPIAQRNTIKTVIALEAMGLGPIRYYIGPGEPPPSEMYLEDQLQTAARMNQSKPLKQATPGAWFRVDDVAPFSAFFPTILIHSVDHSTRKLPGSEQDTPAAINTAAYYESYRLLCYYLLTLDRVVIPKTPMQ